MTMERLERDLYSLFSGSEFEEFIVDCKDIVFRNNLKSMMRVRRAVVLPDEIQMADPADVLDFICSQKALKKIDSYLYVGHGINNDKFVILAAFTNKIGKERRGLLMLLLRGQGIYPFHLWSPVKMEEATVRTALADARAAARTNVSINIEHVVRAARTAAHAEACAETATIISRLPERAREKLAKSAKRYINRSFEVLTVIIPLEDVLKIKKGLRNSS